MNLQSLLSEPFCSKHRKILKASDIEIIEAFIAESIALNPNDRALKINRLFTDMPNKPKTWAYIQEILTMLNNREYQRIYGGKI